MNKEHITSTGWFSILNYHVQDPILKNGTQRNDIKRLTNEYSKRKQTMTVILQVTQTEISGLFKSPKLLREQFSGLLHN